MQSAVSRGFGVSWEHALEVHGAIGEDQGEADEWVSSIQGILQKRGSIRVKNLEMILLWRTGWNLSPVLFPMVHNIVKASHLSRVSRGE